MARDEPPLNDNEKKAYLVLRTMLLQSADAAKPQDSFLERE
jgi:hypothetical protein